MAKPCTRAPNTGFSTTNQRLNHPPKRHGRMIWDRLRRQTFLGPSTAVLRGVNQRPRFLGQARSSSRISPNSPSISAFVLLNSSRWISIRAWNGYGPPLLMSVQRSGRDPQIFGHGGSSGT